MTLHTFDELTYAVTSGSDGHVQYFEMAGGTALETPHAIELFSDEELAKARAHELGYRFSAADVPTEFEETI